MKTYVISVKRTKIILVTIWRKKINTGNTLNTMIMQDLSPLDILALVARHMQKHLIQLRRRESGFMR